MSSKTSPLVRRARIIILSGPSGAGKTTLHEHLLRSPRFRGRIVRSISATTRAPRGQERHGRDYLFLSRKMFEHKIRTGQLLEWARVFDNYYGTPLANARRLLRAGKSVLLCIDVQGARQVRKKEPEALLIFVKTPTLAELKRRLVGRGTDDRRTVALRLRTARVELREAARYDHVIINDRLPRAVRELEDILAAEIGVKGRGEVR